MLIAKKKLLLRSLILTNFIKLPFISAATRGNLNDTEMECFLHKEMAFLFLNLGLLLIHICAPGSHASGCCEDVCPGTTSGLIRNSAVSLETEFVQST